MFKKVKTNIKFNEMELEVLDFWQKNDIFGKSLEQTKGNKEFVFYDGPPFATGLPHYGHLLASIIKDVIPRFKTMEGYYVERRFGWDCHGLPVEYEIEKEMNLNGKKEIEAYGIDKFNEACRSIVLRYTKEWRKTVERVGRWVDFDNDYKTMTPEYMESIWWVFKSIWDKGLIYEGVKVLPYCPRCATPLSNFETNQGYEEIQDPAITVKFKVVDQPNTHLLAWTTTPWTLPSNLALAVHPTVTYVRIKDADQIYILAKARLPHYYKSQEEYEFVEELSGEALVGLRYEPLMPYFSDKATEGCFRVVEAEFVSIEDGTGIVHIAPAFGEDDNAVGKKENLGIVCPIDAEGKFTSEVPDYQGQFVKDADKAIIRRLKDENKVLRHETCLHNYPFCWRCQSPLIYNSISTWFLQVEKIKDKMIENNQKINWMPQHLRDGRFGNWLENVRDWAISRNRYWGTPIPVWKCDCGNETCIGSIAELKKASKQAISDLHRHFIDQITIECTHCGNPMKRVSEVLDCWFESGSMPYAQNHYPFENKDKFESHFPADFIAEGLDQTRGWFYTLLVISTALFDVPPFKNVVVNGLVLAKDGKKMSKRLKNYTMPDTIIEKHCGDALRMYMLSSPVVKAENLRFADGGVVELLRNILIPLWNAYYFFVSYANIDKWTPDKAKGFTPENVLDTWILSMVEKTTEDLRHYLDQYDLQKSITPFIELIDLLTNWYIRRSRRRFWASEQTKDKNDAYATLYTVLLQLARLAAPFMPFISEAIYQNLRQENTKESVHLTAFPESTPALRKPDLETQMDMVIQAVSMGRYLRTHAKIKIRQPLQTLHVITKDTEKRQVIGQMSDILSEELNVKEVIFGENEDTFVTFSIKPNMKVLGPQYGKEAAKIAKAINTLGSKDIQRFQAGDTVTVQVEGKAIPLTKEDVYINREEKEGFLVRNEGTLTIALDPMITTELLHEGITRDFINKVQKMRKDLDLDFVDKIRISYTPTPTLKKALKEHQDYLMSETLANEIIESQDIKNGVEWEINEEKTIIGIEKVD